MASAAYCFLLSGLQKTADENSGFQYVVTMTVQDSPVSRFGHNNSSNLNYQNHGWLF
jgi:hypothetical protein